MQFRVPLHKDDTFPTRFFDALARGIDSLGRETGKWPDKIRFTGTLGREINEMIETSGWNLDRFDISHENSVSNLMIISYTKDLSQMEDVDLSGNPTIQHQGGKISGKIVNGIPTEDAVNSFISHASFKIERSIKPELRVKLTR
jgi:hypothetical protein